MFQTIGYKGGFVQLSYLGNKEKITAQSHCDFLGTFATIAAAKRAITINHKKCALCLNAGKMEPSFVKSGFDYLPAIKCGSSGNVRVLYGDVLATANVAKKYAQIEINRINAKQ